MKIYFITLHRCENYGSVLQTFALQETLVSMKHDVTVLDYIPFRCTNKGLLLRLKDKSPKFKNPFLLCVARVLIYPSYLRKNRVFSNYIHKYIRISKQSFSTSDEAIGVFDDADVYCTGSDQVWNSHWNEGIDRALYLDFAPKGKLYFSYAASIGLPELPKEELEETRRLLDKYEFLSVREDTGVKILSLLGRDDAVQVLDPTLLLQREIWERYVRREYKDERYVLTYNLHHDPEIDKYAQAIAKEYNIKVYNVSYNWHDVAREGKLIWCPSVETFLGLIRDAQFVIADSFHALAFSIIFEKQFVCMCPEIASSRISSLLKLLGLFDRMEYKYSDTSKLNTSINWHDVNERLQQERGKSIEYLKMVLNSTSFTHNK